MNKFRTATVCKRTAKICCRCITPPAAKPHHNILKRGIFAIQGFVWQSMVISMELQTYNIKSGVNLHYIHTTKFKTTTLGIYIHLPLTKETVTKDSLLSMVIKRACPLYPTTRVLAEQLDYLYGADFETNVRKKGDCHIISANFSFLNEKYITSHEPILNKVLSMAESIVLKQDGFDDDIVAQEKENLKQEISAQKNDKRSYAMKRCVEEMCKNEPYGIPRLGVLEDIDGITSDELYRHYKEHVMQGIFDVFVVGDVDIDSVEMRVKQMFAAVNVKSGCYCESTVVKTVGEVKNITEMEHVQQGKLSMGFRTKIEATDDKYPAVVMYNAILGGGLFSKLFNNVREKLSLAYYASSSVDYLKGIMNINSGIEVKNYQLCYDEILTQMDDMKNGKISEQEFTAGRLGVVNNIKSLTDNPFSLEDYYLSRFIIGKVIDIDDLAAMMERVTVEQVVEVARLIELDTVYFLCGE